MLDEPVLQSKRILMVDRQQKTTNDRTWCFWEKEAGRFESIVYRRWSQLWFHGDGDARLKDAIPYWYKLIRGIDFYQYCLRQVQQHPNVEVIRGEVSNLQNDGDIASVEVDGRPITARKIFNSIPQAIDNPRKGDWHLLQHFKGWVIRTRRPAFTPERATLMDFRTSQDKGMAFLYVLPFSETRALVEYTVFSEEPFPEEKYTTRLVEYIRDVLQVRDYIIQHRELGAIPMTTRPFPKGNGAIRHIGAAGGLTKPSSGYTFAFIQHDSASIVRSLTHGGIVPAPTPYPRFAFYDRVLLNVLATGKLPGQEVFSRLLTNSSLPDLFAFLDNASSPRQDWKIIRSLPSFPFLRAAFREFSFCLNNLV
jgi:lycopene beta-cyclase